MTGTSQVLNFGTADLKPAGEHFAHCSKLGTVLQFGQLWLVLLSPSASAGAMSVSLRKGSFVPLWLICAAIE